MKWLVPTLALLIAGCNAEVPEHVAAFEVPLRSAEDRHELLTILSEVAKSQGHHVDVASHEELQRTAKVIPEANHLIKAAVWRGNDHDEPLVSVMDGYDHLGLAWMIFTKGENPAVSTRFREEAMRRIRSRWPDTMSLPVQPGGITVTPSEQAVLRAQATGLQDPE